MTGLGRDRHVADRFRPAGIAGRWSARIAQRDDGGQQLRRIGRRRRKTLEDGVGPMTQDGFMTIESINPTTRKVFGDVRLRHQGIRQHQDGVRGMAARAG